MLNFFVLHVDAEVHSIIPPGVEPPEPKLSDRAIHQAHQQGKYRPLKPAQKRETLVLLPQQQP